MIAYRKKYLPQETYKDLVGEYNECSRMLRAIERAIDGPSKLGRSLPSNLSPLTSTRR